MKPNTEQSAQIRASFAEMRSKEDLVKVLNLAKKILYGSNATDFALKNITYYADQRISKNRYASFQIPKKRGGHRTIHAPVHGLKAILRALNFVLLCVYEDEYEDNAMGFIPGRSIKDNALRHAGKHYVYNIDLKDFFPSIELYRIKAILQLPPFNLKNEQEPLAYLLANLCCEAMEVERREESGDLIKKMAAVLPQGAPTSPTLTNFIARRMDRRLKGASKRFGVTYTRYADDITFSSNHNVYQKESAFILEVRKIIAEQGFLINESKVRLQQSGFRQEVTGLIVNAHPNVPTQYVKQVRQWIYLWETYGFVKATHYFRRDYLQKSAHSKVVIPPLDRVLDGKLRYMRMVVGENHPTWQKLNARFILLAGDQIIEKSDLPDLNEALESLFVEVRKDIDAFIAEAEQFELITQEDSIDDEETIG
jgi:retron-type reverse transcriptase